MTVEAIFFSLLVIPLSGRKQFWISLQRTSHVAAIRRINSRRVAEQTRLKRWWKWLNYFFFFFHFYGTQHFVPPSNESRGRFPESVF